MTADDALSEKAAGILGQFPGPVTLYLSKLKWTTLFVTMTLVAALGAWWLLDPTLSKDSWDIAEALFLLLLGGALAVLSAATLLTNYMTLILDARSLETTVWLFKRRRYSWKDVDSFTTYCMSVRGLPLRFVVFHDATRPLGFWYSIGNMNMRLPDTYGLRAEDLVRLLTAWRERALAQSR